MKEIKPEIEKLQQKYDDTLERAKMELIYKRYFTSNGKPLTEQFYELVRKAYADIMKIIPETNDHYQQEDWLLAGWLIRERDYDTRIEIEFKDRQRFLADDISQIRKKK